jgi:hypothetical protein
VTGAADAWYLVAVLGGTGWQYWAVLGGSTGRHLVVAGRYLVAVLGSTWWYRWAILGGSTGQHRVAVLGDTWWQFWAVLGGSTGRYLVVSLGDTWWQYWAALCGSTGQYSGAAYLAACLTASLPGLCTACPGVVRLAHATLPHPQPTPSTELVPPQQCSPWTPATHFGCPSALPRSLQMRRAAAPLASPSAQHVADAKQLPVQHAAVAPRACPSPAVLRCRAHPAKPRSRRRAGSEPCTRPCHAPARHAAPFQNFVAAARGRVPSIARNIRGPGALLV